MSRSKMPFDPNVLFQFEKLDEYKMKVAILTLTMQNNALLKMLVQKATADDRVDDILAEYDSQVASIWEKVYSQLDINDKDKDLEIEL